MLVERIFDDIKTAMKAKEEAKTSILRMVSAAFKNKKIELMRDLTEDEAQAVVRTLVKQYRDAISDFKKGNRQDLVDKTEAEVVILEAYLPKAPSEDEIMEAVKKAISETGASGANDFGKVMGLAMKKLGAGASGGQVTKSVRELLG